VESSNFARCRLVSESYLKKHCKNGDKYGLYGPDVFQVTLLGPMKRAQKPPELLYAVTSHRPKAKIFNLVQVSACILSQSRYLFFGKILTILRVFDPRKLEIAYLGEKRLKSNTKLYLCNYNHCFRSQTPTPVSWLPPRLIFPVLSGQP
jgi:hypothetical protein